MLCGIQTDNQVSFDQVNSLLGLWNEGVVEEKRPLKFLSYNMDPNPDIFSHNWINGLLKKNPKILIPIKPNHE